MSKMGIGGDKETMSSEEHAAMTEKTESEKTDPKFKAQLTNLYKSYLIMKDAFVESDENKVHETAANFSKSLASVDMGLLQGDAHMLWMNQLSLIEKAIKEMHSTSDIEEQRIAFARLNLAFYNSIKTYGLNDITTFYQYCPMADRDKGAYWLSASKEIQNPYFGDAMLACGETKETIK
jgi:Cu(I)/Ag(I) efflux system membrane fusion protein